MTGPDWIALVALLISIGAFILSIVLAWNSIRIGKVTLEQAFLSDIKEARNRYSSLFDKIIEIDQKDKQKKELSVAFLEERLEEYLNSLDYACGKYLSKIMNKKSFEENFKRLVQEVYENEKLFKNVMNGDKNRFVSLKKVYEEFFTQCNN
ncbi:MAG: hypothetical protein LHW56_01230 [Candidatus Cloacimonetes bacterium]|nr:hypothetical protein [Candidatus Cloacimonadota bacterium]MDY0171508.1 hypothetical protein [Candidatus Cloacimonadaceae bacterium]